MSREAGEFRSENVHDDDLLRLAARYGTPCYVYFAELIEARLAALAAAFGPCVGVSYAVKCNPNPGLLGWLAGRVDGLDISSVGEMRLACRAGWSPAAMSFTGPGKRAAEIAEAIEAGVGELVLESVDEALTADRVARALGRRQRVLVRLAPSEVPKGFGDRMAGRPCAFGIDVETMHEEIPAILALGGLEVVGLHIYSGTQCLVPAAICANWRLFMAIFREVAERHDLAPQKLVFGSGLGIPHFDSDVPLDLGDVADGIRHEFAAFAAEPRFRGARLLLETGRYVVGEAGYFVTRVIRTKQSRGTGFAICDGGMNQHLAASGNFGMVVRRNYRMHRVGGGIPDRPVTVVGPLCTPIDRLGVDVLMPPLAPGDLVAVHASGAYGLTASPVGFISHDPAREILVDRDAARDVSRPPGDLAG